MIAELSTWDATAHLALVNRNDFGRHRRKEAQDFMNNSQPRDEAVPEMLPCPFCGSVPTTGITGAPECDNWRYVQCSNEYCGIRHDLFSVKGWNTRIPPATTDARLLHVANALDGARCMLDEVIKSPTLSPDSSALTRKAAERIHYGQGQDVLSVEDIETIITEIFKGQKQ